MPTLNETAVLQQCDTLPSPPAGVADRSATVDTFGQCPSANSGPMVTIVCSCGKRVSVDESEIRRAMTTILGFGEVLAQELSESEHAYAAEAIHRSGQQLLQMLCGSRG